jgi:hypothetical protein
LEVLNIDKVSTDKRWNWYRGMRNDSGCMRWCY